MAVLHFIQQYIASFWQVFSAMAPWLLFGYLLAGFIAFILTPEQVKKHLNGGGFKTILKAVLLGVPLPLCSCGVIPVAASLREEGAGKGATSAFFISTPQTGIDSFILTWSMVGAPLALVRLLIAYITGLAGGWAVEKFCLPDAQQVNEKEEKKCCCCCCHSEEKQPIKKEWKKAPQFILHYGFIKMLKSMSPSLMLGMLIAALIEMLVPQNFGADFIAGRVWLEFILVIALALPLYVCSSASVPIAVALILKGFSPGAALVFLVAGPGISSVSVTSMKSILGTKATVISVAVIGLCAVIGGIIVNLFDIPFELPQIYEQSKTYMVYVKLVSGIILGALVVNALYNRWCKK